VYTPLVKRLEALEKEKANNNYDVKVASSIEQVMALGNRVMVAS